MRGNHTGSLGRVFLHSTITESLWYSVAEVESLFSAKLSHAVMLAAMYGNPAASLDDGNEKVHEMYVSAINTLPYMQAFTGRAASSDTDKMVEEWKQLNAGLVENSGGESK